MDRENFVSQLTQILGFTSAISISISQYLFRDNFKFLFKNNQELYTASSLVALIVSLALLIALFSNRYVINIKFYFNSKKRDKYYKYLNETSNVGKDMDSKPEKKEQQIVPEPWNYTISRVSVLLIFLAIACFAGMVIYDNVILTSLLYIIFICSTVVSIGTFAIKIYLENDYKIREKNMDNLIMEKIKEYLVGNVKIKAVNRDYSNIINPYKTIFIEHNEITYKVLVSTSNPDSFFSIEKINLTS